MSRTFDYSDELLQSFVDDELDLHARAEVMEAIQHDDALSCRVCELLQIKDSVRLAYREPAQPERTRARLADRWYRRFPLQAAAALLLFVLGTVTGILLQSPTGLAGTHNSLLAKLGGQQDYVKRVIIHVNSGDVGRLKVALDETEELLSDYREHPDRVQVEVVASAAGLNLLRTDTSPYPQRVRQLVRQFHNIHFLACSRSIDKLKLRGVKVNLLPEATVIPGALEEIVDRMQQGWIYIRA